MAYEIIVSEPWDFTNGSNENIITGRIVKQIDKNSIIFESILSHMHSIYLLFSFIFMPIF